MSEDLLFAARIAEKQVYKYSDEKQIKAAKEIASVIRAKAGKEPETCSRCGSAKSKTIFCVGCDDCGDVAYVCKPWGSYCCKCGADYARGQM